MKPMTSFLAAMAASLFSLVCVAAAEDGAWTVDYAESKLGFKASQNGAGFEGAFEGFTATIVFDPAEVSASSIEVVVDMSTAKTGDRQKDQALPGSDWFRVKDHPQATYRQASMNDLGDGDYESVGTLTMRGVSKDVTLAFSLAIDGDTATAEGTTTIIRSDFGVGQGQFSEGKWVSLEVEIPFKIVASR
ncbi:MAG: YceI family protein [Pseudomonadota bacterium]